MTGTILSFALLFAVSAFPAKKDRDWKTGKVLDSSTDKHYVQTGATTTSYPTYGGYGAVSAQTQATTATVKETHVVIEGADYTYTINDQTVREPGVIALRKSTHGCRYIVGEEIKYVAEQRILFVQDVDGKECKVEILRQAKNQPASSKP